MPRILTHIAPTDRPAPDATILYGQCGTAYARRNPDTREIWHDALAIPASTAATWQQVWGHQWALCHACWSQC